MASDSSVDSVEEVEDPKMDLGTKGPVNKIGHISSDESQLIYSGYSDEIVIESYATGSEVGCTDESLIRSSYSTSSDTSGREMFIETSESDMSFEISGEEVEVDLKGDDMEVDFLEDEAAADLSGKTAKANLTGDNVKVDLLREEGRRQEEEVFSGKEVKAGLRGEELKVDLEVHEGIIEGAACKPMNEVTMESAGYQSPENNLFSEEI